MSAPISTTCCIVGAGPAGMVLGYLLARKGIDVTVLEAHEDFDREFRGDTFHASSLDLMDQMGLADKVLNLSQSKISHLEVTTDEGTFKMADLGVLKTKFPFIAMVPQEKFLQMMSNEAQRFSNFKILMGATATDLVKENDQIVGVKYRFNGQNHEIRSLLTVACDGRNSRMRHMAGIALKKFSPPMNVFWFVLPSMPQDHKNGFGFGQVKGGKILIIFNRGDYYQVGYVILKSDFKDTKALEFSELKEEIKKVAPDSFHQRIDELHDKSQIKTFVVQAGRISQWHQPGLLLIGDAAHVMSPVGGVGINYAIQDAVAAYNYLSEDLLRGELHQTNLAKVQNRREWPTKVIQKFQSLMQKRVIAAALKSPRGFKLPWFLKVFVRLPLIRYLLPRMIAYGIRTERLEH